MCQVTPFTLPCCRRIYVQADKLPSCPDDWPKKKCPRELCVQISGYEAKDVLHQHKGICWRCLAVLQGKGAHEREHLRPVLDRAFIAEGLDEFTIEERRRRIEKARVCWFCGASGDRASCGTVEDMETAVDMRGRKGNREMIEGEMEPRKIKMAKINHSEASMPNLTSPFTASSVTSLPAPSSNFAALSCEQQPPDPAFRPNNHNHGGFGHGPFIQPAPTFNYYSQQMPLRIPEDASGSWQGGQAFRSHESFRGDSGSSQNNASLEHIQLRKNSKEYHNLPLPQSQEFAPVPDFGSEFINFDLHPIDDDAFHRFLARHDAPVFHEPQVLKSEFHGSVANVPEAEQPEIPAKCAHADLGAPKTYRNVVPIRYEYPTPPAATL